MKINVRELKPSMWRDVERLFGERGAVGGCWCMWWRQPRGEQWNKVKGAENRRRFRRLVTTGRAHGALAYVKQEPVGWISFDRRTDFDKLDRAPSFVCSDAERVWSLPCFYIKAGFRGQGVATALLKFAVEALHKRHAAIVEAYAVKPRRKGTKIPAAFAWTGTTSMFAAAGFRAVGRRDGGKQRMRLAARALRDAPDQPC